jgi:NAD(P)H dehydrogenase (quinone)
MPAELIAVVGAAGKTGRAVLKALHDRHVRVRPLVRRLSGLDGEARVDLLRIESLRAALNGVSAVYHMAPNMHPAEVEIGGLMIAAALDAGVERIVYHSVLHPQVNAMPHHWDKLQVEEKLIDSALHWTILQPAPYIQNFTRPVDGVIRIVYRSDAPFSFVDLADVGQAAAITLTSGSFDSGIYELAGPSILTMTDVAATLGTRVESIDARSWERAALAGGMDPESARRLVAMFEHYDRHGLVGNPTALAMLLGRAPTDPLTALLRDSTP